MNHVLCDGGLCNRLNALMFALILKRKFGGSWRISWPVNNWCGAPFESLFTSELPHDDRSIDSFKLKVNPETVVWQRIDHPHWEADLKARLQEHVAAEGQAVFGQVADVGPDVEGAIGRGQLVDTQSSQSVYQSMAVGAIVHQVPLGLGNRSRVECRDTCVLGQHRWADAEIPGEAIHRAL